MKRYCQIYKDIAWWIFESDTPPEFAPDIVIKDISEAKYDDVREGWEYNSELDLFTEPKYPEPTQPIPDIIQVTQDTLMEEKYQTLLMEMILNQ